MGWLEDLTEWATGEGSLMQQAFGRGSVFDQLTLSPQEVIEWGGKAVEDVGEWAQPGIDAITGKTAADAAEEAARMQQEASEKGIEAQKTAAEQSIEEQRRQFDTVTELLSDYVGIGKDALGSYRALAGLGTPEEQQAQIDLIKQSPEFNEMIRQGEESILAQASATGGLRGGRTQDALMQYRPQVLSNLINQQLSRFGGLSTLGQQSAARTGAAGQQMAGQTGAYRMGAAGNIADLYGDIGAYGAGGLLGATQAKQQGIGNLINLAGTIGGFF